MGTPASTAREREYIAFNRPIDWDTEAHLGTVFFGVETNREFPPLDIDTIRTLAEEGHLDLAASHNESPPGRELLEWAADVQERYTEHQFEIGFTGHMVSPDRPDARISIEGVSIRCPGPIPEALKTAVARRFAPDLLTVDDFFLEIRWD